MLFHDAELLALLLVVGVGYFSLPRRSAIVALAVAGFVFYGFWNVALVLLLAGSTLFNFLTGIVVDGASGNKRRLALTVAVAGNLARSVSSNTWISSSRALPQSFHSAPINFSSTSSCPSASASYTFEGIAYNVDVYRGDMPATRSLTRFALFLSFFPHLIAGPIIRPQYFFPQIDRRRRPTAEETAMGPPIPGTDQEVGLRRQLRDIRRRLLQRCDRSVRHAGRPRRRSLLQHADLFRFRGIYRHRAGMREAAGL